eukprot:SAG22_NODE_351_length_11841_cov_945.797990_1_plen_147_part_10
MPAVVPVRAGMAGMLAAAAAAVAAPPAARSSLAPGAGSGGCKGYLVSGAGDAAFDGCYPQQKSKYSGRALFAKDAAHQLYTYQGGPWRLGDPGSNVSYAAITETPWPPQSAGGCGTGWELGGHGIGRAPCPAVKRSGLPPPPPLPPP